MKLLKIALLSATVSVSIYAAAVQSGWWSSSSEQEDVELVELNWDDLIPADFQQPENPFNTMTQEEIDKLLDGSDESNARLAQLQAEFEYAPVVESLDGKRVKLPAYVTPLDFDGQLKMSEFLLVPYMGACIHTPPPPANQVVYADSGTPIELNSPYDPIWAVGVLRAVTVNSDLAEAGYKLEVEEVMPYSR
ncbi:DUF3299 domain-containing protein [Granulosicoccus sp. 3-233]|uniref:DUF3299 domain-containing protein n=1 Tax=Granulosicoccus sp. 3-233 TaxID=3417969 RepID=UPI003D34985D